MKRITVREYIENKPQSKVYIPTSWGNKEVTGLNDMFGYPSVYCGKDNGGFGMSYAAHYGTVLLVEE